MVSKLIDKQASNRESGPVLELRAVSKNFGGVRALHDVDFDVRVNEILCVVGDNGAGKSTLIKIIAGVHQPSGGEIRMNDRIIKIPSPRAARELGIETVYQELALVDNLDVVENIFLGRTTTRFRWFIDRKHMIAEARAILERLNIAIPSLTDPIENLSGGQRQALAISRALAWGGRIVILDEPTAALGVKETAKVLNLIKQLKSHGVAVIVISHNMRDVFDISDRILVLRGGRRMGMLNRESTDINEVVKLITGYEPPVN